MQEEEPSNRFAAEWTKKWQYLLDKSSPHVAYRWVGFAVSLYIYFMRVYFVNGWYIVTYGLGIYLLNQSIGFLSPQVYLPLICGFFLCIYLISITCNSYLFLQFDPEEADGDMDLPTSSGEEFR
jgi:Rer1 family